jgi:hypothetical protein
LHCVCVCVCVCALVCVCTVYVYVYIVYVYLSCTTSRSPSFLFSSVSTYVCVCVFVRVYVQQSHRGRLTGRCERQSLPDRRRAPGGARGCGDARVGGVEATVTEPHHLITRACTHITRVGSHTQPSLEGARGTDCSHPSVHGTSVSSDVACGHMLHGVVCVCVGYVATCVCVFDNVYVCLTLVFCVAICLSPAQRAADQPPSVHGRSPCTHDGHIQANECIHEQSHALLAGPRHCRRLPVFGTSVCVCVCVCTVCVCVCACVRRPLSPSLTICTPGGSCTSLSLKEQGLRTGNSHPAPVKPVRHICTHAHSYTYT